MPARARRNRRRCFWPLLIAAAVSGCWARPDDALEPNDSAAQATPLEPGVALSARANQGNPDVFAVRAEAGRTLLITLESLGLEECPAFRLDDPHGRTLYADAYARCRRVGGPAVQQAGVTFEHAPGVYRLRVAETTAGTYLLQVLEGGDADNLSPYSWDFRVRVTLH